MNKWVSFVIMLLAVIPLPFINQIQGQRPLEFTPAFFGEFIGMTFGAMVLGVIVGYVLWKPVQLIVGLERAPKLQHFVTAATVVVAVFMLVGIVVRITHPDKYS